MRMGELSRRTGVPVPTIKYYQREGLLPAGERTSPNQVHYGEDHVGRIKLIRALFEVGGLSIADIRALLAIMEAPQSGLFQIFGAAQHALSREAPERPNGRAPAAARREVEQLLDRRGWRVGRTNPSIETAATALDTWRELTDQDLGAILDSYADAAERIAAVDIAAVRDLDSIDDMVQFAVVGTLLGEVLLNALRRLAHENAGARLFGASTPVGTSDDANTASRKGQENPLPGNGDNDGGNAPV